MYVADRVSVESLPDYAGRTARMAGYEDGQPPAQSGGARAH